MTKTAAPAEIRRSSRLAISLPIVVHGKDAQQKAFREDTRTLLVNRHGAKILISQPMMVGAEVLIENPALGNLSKAKVLWLSAKRNENGLYEAGVQLAESQNLWGIEFDLDDSVINGKDQGLSMPTDAPTQPRMAAVENPPGKTPPPGATSEQTQFRLLQNMRETAEAQAREFRDRLLRIADQSGAEVERALRERVAAAKREELSSLEQQVLETQERLASMNAELAGLNARIAESQVSLYAALENMGSPLTAEQIQERIETDALSALHLITEGGIASARERIQAQMQADTRQSLASWRNDLQNTRDSSVEEARLQIMAASTFAVEGFNREREAGLEEIKRRIQEQIQESEAKVVSQMMSKLDQAAGSHTDSLEARLNDAYREIGKRQTNLLQNQLDALLVSRMEQAQRHAQSVGESLQKSVDESLRTAGEKSSRELCARLQEIAEQTAASASDEVGKRVEAAATALAGKYLEGLETRMAQVAEHAVAASSTLVQKRMEELASATGEEALRAWQAKLETAAQGAASLVQKRVEDLASATGEEALQAWQAKLETAAQGTASLVQRRVEELASATGEEALQVWRAKLKTAAQGTASFSVDQVREQINEALKLVGPRLQEMQERAVSDTLEVLRGRLSSFIGLLEPTGNR